MGYHDTPEAAAYRARILAYGNPAEQERLAALRDQESDLEERWHQMLCEAEADASVAWERVDELEAQALECECDALAEVRRLL